MSKKPLEKTIKDYFDQYGAILVGMHEDLQGQQAKVDKKLDEAKSNLSDTLSASERRFSDATGEVKQIRNQLHEGMAKHAQHVQEVLSKHREINTAHRNLLEQQHAQLNALYAETNLRLTSIDEKIEAHQLREAAFNKRLRQILVGITVAACIGLLATAVLWKT